MVRQPPPLLWTGNRHTYITTTSGSSMVAAVSMIAVVAALVTALVGHFACVSHVPSMECAEHMFSNRTTNFNTASRGRWCEGWMFSPLQQTSTLYGLSVSLNSDRLASIPLSRYPTMEKPICLKTLRRNLSDVLPTAGAWIREVKKLILVVSLSWT